MLGWGHGWTRCAPSFRHQVQICSLINHDATYLCAWLVERSAGIVPASTKTGRLQTPSISSDTCRSPAVTLCRPSNLISMIGSNEKYEYSTRHLRCLLRGLAPPEPHTPETFPT